MFHGMINTITWARGKYRGMLSVKLAKVSKDGEQRSQELNISHLYSFIAAVGGWRSDSERMLSPQQHPPVRSNIGVISNESTECLKCIPRLHPQNMIRSVHGRLASHIESTSKLPDRVNVSLEYLQASSTLNVPYSGKEKGIFIFGLNRHVRLLIFLVHLKPFKTGRCVQYTIHATLKAVLF